ncbi:MAG: hypothetical protein KatS3mg104_1280 [Phycisphaerae bacterium]|jgi:hypothetical protein|nr:MAG: hypothetical protein KatS3mg104_1280 [Phycisphaerae bacterium]
MNRSSVQLPEWLPESLRDDPRKTGILGVLLLVLLVVLLRYWLWGGGPTSVQASSGIKPKLNQQTGSSSTIRTNAIRSATAPNKLRQWLETPVNSVSRNLFVIQTEFYPTKTAKSVSSEPESGEFWEEVEKLRSFEADQKRRQDILIQNLQREAAKLRLQSTVMGPEPQAIIGGSLVKKGDVVASDRPGVGVQFRVLAIEARRVILEREGIKLELRMQK